MLIMKKLTAIFLCFAMALSLAACGNTTSSTNESSTPESSVPPASGEASDTSSTAASQEPAFQGETEVEAGNTLVVYFSATGNTEQAATYIADITGGDLFELEPADPYTDEDLNYNNESGHTQRYLSRSRSRADSYPCPALPVPDSRCGSCRRFRWFPHPAGLLR